MTRKEKCELAIKLGFTYNGLTGDVITPSGKALIKTTKNGYLMLTLRDKERKIFYLYAHQFVYFIVHNEIVNVIDHIDGNKQNNFTYNLRSVTQSQNGLNRRNVKGYSFCKRANKWIAKIMINRKGIHLGTFENENDARKCYLLNKEKYQ
jgi:hypothetical protein